MFILLNNKILTEVMIIEAILSEHIKNENIDQISIMLSAEFFKLNHQLNTVNVLNSDYQTVCVNLDFNSNNSMFRKVRFQS